MAVVVLDAVGELVAVSVAVAVGSAVVVLVEVAVDNGLTTKNAESISATATPEASISRQPRY